MRDISDIRPLFVQCIWFILPIVLLCAYVSVSVHVCSGVFSCSMLCACFSLMDLCTLCIYDVLQVLFDKLCLHEQCKNKKLPKTLNKQQQSTSEAAVRRAQTHWSCRFQSLVLFHLPSQCLHLSVFSVCLCIQFRKINAEEHKLKTQILKQSQFSSWQIIGSWCLTVAKCTEYLEFNSYK